MTKEEKKQTYTTKDYWEIIFLSAKGHIPEDIRTGPENSDVKIHLEYVFPASVQEDLDALARGVPDAVTVDIRKIRSAIEQFKRNMHRMLPHSRRN